MTRQAVTATILRRRLGSNVRAKRTSLSLTIKAAAKLAHVHWRHWQKIEAGQTNATLLTLSRIAEALDVEPGHLLLEPPAGAPVAPAAET